MTEQKSKVKEKATVTAGEVKLVSSERQEYAIYEQVDGQFLYYEQGSGFMDKREFMMGNSIEEVYKPLQVYPFAVLDEPLAYNTIEELFSDIRTFLSDHVDLQDENCYDLLASFIIATWRAEDFGTAAYLLFLGDFGTGKTRALEVLLALSYRAIAAASISSAALVRLLQKYRTTMLIDETELLNHESRQEIVAILNSGYKRGQYYIRAQQDSSEVELWDVFGFKALAGTEDFVRTLNSRCIIIPMERNVRPVAKGVDKGRALQIRRKLLHYRFTNLHKALLDVTLPFRNGRNNELFIPLVLVAPEQSRQVIIDYGLKLESARAIDEATSFEADVLRALLALKKPKLKAIDLLDFLNVNGNIVIDMQSSKQVQSYRSRIGRVLNNKFHFEKNTKNEFYIDKPKLDRLSARYLPPEKANTSNTTNTLDSIFQIQSIGFIGNNGNSGVGRAASEGHEVTGDKNDTG